MKNEKKNRQNGRTGLEEFKDYVICDFMAKLLNGMSINKDNYVIHDGAHGEYFWYVFLSIAMCSISLFLILKKSHIPLRRRKTICINYWINS